MKYEIQGGNFTVVICNLEANETMISEGGGMSWMSPNMEMKTTSNGGIGKVIGRMVTREKMFQNKYTALGGPGMIAFGSSLPGEIIALEISPDKEYVAQKASFLASTEDVQLSTFFQKKICSGVFSGEGFILSKITGNGMVFLEINGSVVEYDLKAGESIVCATGYMAAMDDTCSMDIVQVKGVKNVLFGGESLFNTKITGPGRVLIQTMPIMSVAEALIPYLPNKS